MKHVYFTVIFILIIVFYGCDSKEPFVPQLLVKGEVLKVEYIPAGWTEYKKTFIYFKKGGVCVIQTQHVSIPNKKYIEVWKLSPGVAGRIEIR